MRFAFTDEQLALRAAVRAVLERRCTTDDLRAMADRGGGGEGDPGRSVERWRDLCALGAPGLLVPEGVGGLGLSEAEAVGVCEEVGRAALPEPLVESAFLAAPLLAQAASLGAPGGPAVADSLGALARGETLATVGGIGVTASGTVARPEERDAEGLVVTGSVAAAGRADLFVLASNSATSGVQFHAVAARAAHIEATPSIDPLRDLGTVRWAPGPATLLAQGPPARAMLEDLADRAAVATAAQLLGLAEAMISIAVAYASQRRQFGRPIGTYQAVAHPLADARVRLEFARPATYRAADSLARGLPERSEHASMAKALASDAADLAARTALQVHGAIGYTWECDLHLFMKRAWVLSAAWGDAATHRARVLRAALGRVAS